MKKTEENKSECCKTLEKQKISKLGRLAEMLVPKANENWMLYK